MTPNGPEASSGAEGPSEKQAPQTPTSPVEGRISRRGLARATVNTTLAVMGVGLYTKLVVQPAAEQVAKVVQEAAKDLVEPAPVQAAEVQRVQVYMSQVERQAGSPVPYPTATAKPGGGAGELTTPTASPTPTLTPTPIGGASGPDTRTRTPTPTVSPTSTETPVPRWTEEQLLANTRIVDFIPTYFDASRNWSLSINSRRVNESPYNEDLYDPQKDALVQTLVPYAKQHGFRQAEFIIVTHDYQLPVSLHLYQSSVRDPESGRVIPIGYEGGTVYQGRLIVVWRAEPNLLSNSPGFISNLNFSTSDSFISAAYSGGNVAAATPTNLRELRNTEPLRTISSTS